MAEGKKVGMWVGIGCGLLLLIGACCGGIGYFVYAQTDAPAQAGHAFFKDLREGNYQQAHQRMSTTYQSTRPLAVFQQNVQAIPALSQSTDSSFSNRQISNGVATLEGTLTTAGGVVPISVQLSQVGEYWYIDSVTVQGIGLQ